MAVTFTVTRIEMKKMLASLGVSDKSVEALLGALDKQHRHANAVSFVNMLMNLGLKQREISNVLRRIGIDDISIANIFDVIDESRIRDSFGRIAEITLG